MIGYLRVSAEEQTSSGLGLESQCEAIQRYADAHGWDLLRYADADLGAKPLDRPQLQSALDWLGASPKRRDVDGIVVVKLDRLSRSVANLAGVLERACARKSALVALDLAWTLRHRPGNWSPTL